MTYEVIQDRLYPSDWRVEAINADGGVYVTVFSGPLAETRALEYAMFKQSAQGKES